MVQNTCNNHCKTPCPTENSDDSLSCFQKIAGTLTGEEIKKHKLIDPIKNNDNLQATTYDLTLGDGHYIYDGQQTEDGKRWKLIFIGNDDKLKELNEQNAVASQYERQNRDRPKTLFIPRFGSAFVQLDEFVDTYSVANLEKLLIVGRFDLKLSQVHRGLISQQATQVEPCYRGKLFCFIHNLSNKEIELKYGEKIATIEFSYVSCFCNSNKRVLAISNLIEKNRAKYSIEYCNENGITEIRYFQANDKLPDNCGLLSLKDEFINTLQSDARLRWNKVLQSWWVPIIVALITLIGVCAPIYSDISTIEEKILKLEQNPEQKNSNTTSTPNISVDQKASGNKE